MAAAAAAAGEVPAAGAASTDRHRRAPSALMCCCCGGVDEQYPCSKRRRPVAAEVAALLAAAAAAEVRRYIGVSAVWFLQCSTKQPGRTNRGYRICNCCNMQSRPGSSCRFSRSDHIAQASRALLCSVLGCCCSRRVLLGLLSGLCSTELLL